MKLNETKMICLSWKKNKKVLTVEIPCKIKELTKRTLLQVWPPWYNFINKHNRKNYLLQYFWFQHFMWHNSATLDREKMGEMGEGTKNESKNTKNIKKRDKTFIILLELCKLKHFLYTLYALVTRNFLFEQCTFSWRIEPTDYF